jgi:hypothetical protein
MHESEIGDWQWHGVCLYSLIWLGKYEWRSIWKLIIIKIKRLIKYPEIMYIDTILILLIPQKYI